MTTLAALILGALLAATLTLPAFVRLIRQRDAARVRGDAARSLAQVDREKAERREQMLLDDLDNACETAVSLRERVEQLEAEALPKAPNWGAAPAEWREQNATPSIFMLHAIENGVVA